MRTLMINCPDIILRSFHATEEKFARELRLAAAVKFFETRQLSSGRAAELAGIPRLLFLHKLAEYGVSIFGDEPDMLARDLATAKAGIQ